MKSKSVQHLQSIKVNDEYGTPHLLFLENCLKFDCSPAVDYFASDKNHVLDKYYTKKNIRHCVNSLSIRFIKSKYKE